MNDLILPKSSWSALQQHLVDLRLGAAAKLVDEDAAVLRQLGYIDEAGRLSQKGANLVTLLAVRRDHAAVKELAYADFIQLPSSQALLQSLQGLTRAGLEQAKMALVFAGADAALVDRNLVNFLTTLSVLGIIVYDRKNRTVSIPINTADDAPLPAHIYVEKSRPFGNDYYIRKIINECSGTVMWMDKYFTKEAFEWLWRATDASKVTKIEILSLDAATVQSYAITDYKRLQKEMAAKGIILEWRTIPAGDAHGFHDRWILDDSKICYNLPSVRTIHSGQTSELHGSPNRQNVESVFKKHFVMATLAA